LLIGFFQIEKKFKFLSMKIELQNILR